MAKQRRTIGTGITARTVESYSGEDMPGAMAPFAERWNAALIEGGGQFGAVVLDTERRCLRILEAAGSGPFEADGVEHFAERILRAITATRNHIALADADAAARAALDVGRLVTEASIKHVWERPALAGAKAAKALKGGGGAANKTRHLVAEREHAQWQRWADGYWTANTHLSRRDVAKRIAHEHGGEANTIRRYIRRQ